jgi:hypothetical protein
MISDFFFLILKPRLVTGIGCCPLPIADIANWHRMQPVTNMSAIGNGQQSMPVTNLDYW